MHDWPAILREHGPLVWRTGYRLLSHDADAHDCFQQTFLAVTAWAAKEAVRDWPAVLLRLATARALEILRSRYRRRLAPLPDDLAGAAGDPLDLAAGGELAGRLREALAEIDPDHATVFCLVCLDGLSNREVADQLGVSANHAGVMLHRARQALRDKLRTFAPPSGREGP